MYYYYYYYNSFFFFLLFLLLLLLLLLLLFVVVNKKMNEAKKQYRYIVYITKTCLINTDALKSHFYTVKLGFTGCTLLFLFLLKNIDCRYSLEPPRRGGSNEYLQSML